jgi:PAS domain S-box-containing protein
MIVYYISMSLLSFAYFFAFTTYLWLGTSVLLKNPKASLNKTCTHLIFSFGLWALCMGFMVSAATETEARMWDNISSIGWCSFPAFGLWFVLTLGERRKVLAKWYFYAAVISLPIAFVAMQWSGLLISRYVKVSWGWAEVWTHSMWTYFFYAYYFSAMMASLLLMLKVRRSATRIVSKQTTIIFHATLFSLVFGSITDVVLPIVDITFPSIASIIILVWAAGLAYAITKYGLLEISVALASSEIIATMPDALLLIRPDTRIINTNSSAEVLTGFTREELIGKHAGVLFPEEPSLFDGSRFDRLLEKGTIRDFAMRLATKQGDRIPVSFSCSVVRDESGSIIGIIAIGRDIREMLKGREKETELKLERERVHALDLARQELEGKIAERTAELKRNFNELAEKKEILERFQKITVGRELEMVRLKDEINALLEASGKPKKYDAPEKVKKILGKL